MISSSEFTCFVDSVIVPLLAQDERMLQRELTDVSLFQRQKLQVQEEEIRQAARKAEGKRGRHSRRL